MTAATQQRVLNKEELLLERYPNVSWSLLRREKSSQHNTLWEHNISPPPMGFQAWNVDTKSWKCPGRERMRTGRGETRGWGWAACDGQAQISAGRFIGMSGACAGAIWGVSWSSGVSCQAEGVASGVTLVVCAGSGTLRRRLACHRVPLLSKKVAGPSLERGRQIWSEFVICVGPVNPDPICGLYVRDLNACREIEFLLHPPLLAGDRGSDSR